MEKEMKYNIQFECMDKSCNTVTIGHNRMDGVRCPRCSGPVFPKPFKLGEKVGKDKPLKTQPITDDINEIGKTLEKQILDLEGKISVLEQSLVSLEIKKRVRGSV